MHGQPSGLRFLFSCKWLFVLSVLVTVNLMLYIAVNVQVGANQRVRVLHPSLVIGNVTSSSTVGSMIMASREVRGVRKAQEDKQTGINSDTDSGNLLLRALYVDSHECVLVAT